MEGAASSFSCFRQYWNSNFSKKTLLSTWCWSILSKCFQNGDSTIGAQTNKPIKTVFMLFQSFVSSLCLWNHQTFYWIWMVFYKIELEKRKKQTRRVLLSFAKISQEKLNVFSLEWLSLFSTVVGKKNWIY